MGVTAALDREQTPWKLQDPTLQQQLNGREMLEKSLIIEIAATAMDELVEGRCLVHHDSHYKLFPKANHLKTASARIESSKDSGEVAVAATHLIEMLLDSNKWKDLFPTIITEARTIEVIDTGGFGGSLNLVRRKVTLEEVAGENSKKSMSKKKPLRQALVVEMNFNMDQLPGHHQCLSSSRGANC